jgi:hypothetical protein
METRIEYEWGDVVSATVMTGNEGRDALLAQPGGRVDSVGQESSVSYLQWAIEDKRTLERD